MLLGTTTATTREGQEIRVSEIDEIVGEKKYPLEPAVKSLKKIEANEMSFKKQTETKEINSRMLKIQQETFGFLSVYSPSGSV